jgi:hypothetical protein
MCEVVGTKGHRLLSIFISCLVLFLFILLFEIISARDLDILKTVLNAIDEAIKVPAGSFAGWLMLIIVAGAVLLIAGGAVTLIKNALDMFNE